MNELGQTLTLRRAEDLSAVPAGHGAIGVFDRAGRCSLLAATGNLRSFCEKRLTSMLEGGHPGGGVVIRFDPGGSMFEAELSYLRAARRIMPETARLVSDRWRCWFLRLDLARGRWSPCSIEEESAADGSSVLIGPMPDKHAPSKLGELIDDVFDLCRYPSELARAPAGKLCAYHEMGRCPAPCHGLEPFDRFLARFAEAGESLRSFGALLAAITSRMNLAAGAIDFERAGELRALLKRVQGRAGSRFEYIAHAAEWAMAAVVPRSRGGAAVYTVRGDGIRFVGEAPSRAERGELAALIERIDEATAGPVRAPYRREGAEEAWLACRRLFRTRRTETYLTRAGALDADTLWAAVRRRPRADDETDSETRVEQT